MTSIDTVHQPSIDTVHPPSDTTCLEAEKVEVLILKVDENGMLRDEEGRTRNNTGQLINAEGAVIPDVIDVAETNDFNLNREWYIHKSTRSNKGIGLLLVEPLDLERVIHKSKRVVDTLQAAIGSVEIQVSIDTVHPTSIDIVHLTSIDTIHPMSIDTIHPPSTDTIHPTSIDTVHQPSIDTVHLPSTNTVHPPSDCTCLEAEKVEVLILKVDKNGMLRDEEGRTRNSTGQLINAEGAVIPDLIDVAETNDFDLNHEWYIHMSTRSNKGIGLLLVEPLDLERVIYKSKRAVDTLQAAIGSVEIQVSIDTVHPTSIDIVHLTSIDTIHPTSIDTIHPPSTDIIHPTSMYTVHQPSIDTVHLPSTNTVHPPSDCTCLEAEKVEVLILKVDENGMLRDEEGRTRNSTGQLINAEGAVIPDLIDVAETKDFDLNHECEQNEVSVDHIICKIFPYSLSGDAFSWFSQLQRRSLTCWEDIKTAFLNKFLYEATTTRHKEFDDMLDKMIKGHEKELMSSFSQMLGIVYTEPNEESETMNAQIEKPNIEDIKTAFLNKFLYEATSTRQKEFDDMLEKMIKGQEKEYMSSFSQMLGIVYTEPNEESETMNAQIEKPYIEVQWTDEFSRREEADISDTTSTSTNCTTSTSTDSRTSTSTYGTTS
ncbi:hypothetical protein F2Q69_00058832 [Brassica cretica]|uniref:Retrotransposon gag domain-containing protein n=1 Tax=Brassica cretica TaxID=69181 RepID=A0A8S9RQ36_BRACR|nr:hypothetical protein F2Q69_00058832 [Brassica cretica]